MTRAVLPSLRWPFELTPRRRRQLWYAPLLAVAMALVLARFLVLARLLDLPGFAAFSGGILISSTYCMVGCLGLQTLLQREWPVRLVQGQKHRGLVGAAQCHLVALATALLACLAIGAGLQWAGMAPLLLTVSVLHGMAQQAFLVATTESRSGGDALGYARQQLLRSGLWLVLGTGVASATGNPLWVIAVEAAVSGLVALAVWRAALMRAALGWRAAFVLAWRRLPALPWRTALTLMVVLLLTFATLNADRWVASRLLSPAGFAHYSFAAIVLAVSQAMQALVNASIYPLLARRFASHGAAVMYRLCLRAAGGFVLIGVLVSLPLYGVLQHGITRWYPQYADVIPLLPLLLGVGVLRLADFWSSFLMIAGHEQHLLALHGATAGTAVLVWLAWVRPWSDVPTTLWDIGLLALLLSVLATAATAGAAWRLRRA
jgi:O-antigen/teichoic acid export membrane protein